MQQLKTLFALILLAFAISAAGCRTSFTKAAKTFDKNPEQAHGYCVTNFPVTPITKTTTKFLKGKRDTIKGETQYVTVDCDSAVKTQTRYVKAPCPPAVSFVSQIDTFVIHDTTVVTDNYAVVQAKIRQSEAEKQASSRLKWAFGGWGLSLLLIAFLVLLFTGKIR